MPAQILHRLVCGRVFDADKIALHKAPRHEARGDGGFFLAETKRAIELGLEAVAVNILGDERIDEAVHLLRDCQFGFGLKRYGFAALS